MSKNIKQLLVSASAILMITGVGASASNANVNAKHRVHTHRVYHHRRRTRVTRRVRRSYALSYYSAKKAVRKAYNGKDKLHDHFSLRNNGRYGNRTYLKAPFGANAIYFTITHSRHYAHIHTTIRASAGDAAISGFPKVRASYYHMYGVQRNKIVRAY